MQYIFTKKFDGTFTMSWVGHPMSNDEISTQLHDIKTFSITPIKGIKTITNIHDIVKGENEKHYFKKYFTYSNIRSSGTTYIGPDITWSETEPVANIIGDYCPFNLFNLNLQYFRIDTTPNSTEGVTLTINSIVIEGTYDIEETDEIINIPNEGYILSPKDIYKVFKLTGYELYGVNTNNLTIKYRFTQDGGRTYTPWEPLTTENISTIKLNIVRFAQVQYSITPINTNIISKVYDIILLGDFQNINNNYLKTNRYGVREDCATKYSTWSGTTSVSTSGTNNICLNGKISYKGDGNVYNYNKDWFTQGLSCYLNGNVIKNMNTQNNDPATASGNYDPYSQAKKIGEWYNYLSNSTNKIIGWTIDYHLNDPDGHGIDRYIHEYQLFNIIDVQKIKVIVPENQFPDNQVQINEFALDMMDTFTILILKDEFHKAFGIEKRPAQKDIIFFCQANRYYRVKHAQVHRDIMYMGIYWNVVLEKFEALANEQNLSAASKALIEPMTKNNTLDALFGEEMRSQENKIVNKQFKPTTHEVYRLDINPKITIVKKDIFNSLKGTKIASTYYNLSSVTAGTSAVTYTLKDSTLEVSDNRAFNLWFNFNNKHDTNKQIDETVFQSYNVNNTTNFNLLNNYDSINLKGYKLWYYNNQVILTINNMNYSLDITGVTTNIWYGLTINLDNRQRKISLDLFKRNYDYNITMFNNDYKSVVLSSTNQTGITYYTSIGYRPVKNTEINKELLNTKLSNIASKVYDDITLNSFSIDKTITIFASDIKMTNIRIFNDVIPEQSKSNILQQRIIQDSNYLILADNATRQLYTQNVPNTRWE
jgi:hypothetical protein